MKTHSGLSRLFNIYLFISLIAFTAACSKDNSPGPEEEKEQALIEGTVTKGIIKSAVVNVYAIEAGKLSNTVLVSTTTNDTGSYSVNIPGAYSGPVMIEMQNNSSNSATMVCDIPNEGCGNGYKFGDDMPLGDLKLRTYLGDVTPGSTQSASVTPLTTMAAAYAESQSNKEGSLDQETIDKANSKVANMLGINNIVLTTAPDITDGNVADKTKDELKYAYLSAAILAIAMQDFKGDTDKAIDVIIDNYVKYGGELISSESKDTADIISLANLASAAGQIALKNDKRGEAYGDLRALYLIATDPEKVDKPTETKPSPTSGLGELEKVKAMVSDVRTWGNVIYAETKLENEQFQKQIDYAMLFYDYSHEYLENTLSRALNVALKAYTRKTTINLSSYFPSYAYTYGQAILSGNSVIVSGKIDNVDVEIQMTFPAQLIGKSFTVTIDNGTIQNYLARLDVDGGVTLKYANLKDIEPWVTAGVIENFPDPDNAKMDLAVSFIQKAYVSNPVTMSGSVQLEMVGVEYYYGGVMRDIMGNVLYYNPQNLSFTGSVSNTTDDSYKVIFNASMANAKSFIPGTEYEYHYRKIRDLSISTIVKLTGLPEASITLSGNRTGFDDGNAELEIAYDGRSFEFQTNIKNGIVEGSIEVTNQDGVVLELDIKDSDILDGSLTYDGKKYGTFDEVHGVTIIRYIDGSFESL